MLPAEELEEVGSGEKLTSRNERSAVFLYVKTLREDCVAVRPDENVISYAVGSSNCDLSRKNCG
jgi:hypothetical protein